jgi:hypothetical protein
VSAVFYLLSMCGGVLHLDCCSDISSSIGL